MKDRKQQIEELLEGMASMRRNMPFRGIESNKTPRITPSQWGVVMLIGQRCKVSIKEVAKALDGGYGIYAGNHVRWATLVFTQRAAQWVSHEQWHPEQQLRTLDDGSVEMKLPFTDLTELSMDVLRHGPEVKVTEPTELSQLVAQQLREALAVYS